MCYLAGKDPNLTHSGPTAPLEARASGPLSGKVRVPGDKSISHRALILGALAVGETRISGLLEGEDVLNTAKSMRALGARVERTGPFAWKVNGVGVGGFAEPASPLDFGNSGTGCRLVMGAVAGCPVTATFDGDASLRSRPMRRILDPLADKLLLVSVFLVLTWLGRVPAWLAVLAVTRDFTIGIGALAYRAFWGALHGRPIASSKLNTLLQILYVCHVVLREAYGMPPAGVVAALGLASGAMVVVSGAGYVREFTRRALLVAAHG